MISLLHKTKQYYCMLTSNKDNNVTVDNEWDVCFKKLSSFQI